MGLCLKTMDNAKNSEILLVYDGQCPACDYYCHMVRIRESVGRLTLVDAREPGDVVNELAEAGYDLDHGMVLKMGSAVYDGADAVHMLALIGSRCGLFNRINAWVFRSRTLSHRLYPVLRFLRNLLLKLLGRRRISR